MMRDLARTPPIPSPLGATVLAMPRAVSFRFPLDASIRRTMAVTLIGVGIAAVGFYIAAVNTLLLDGNALQDVERRRASLEREVARLQEDVAERQSPAWIQARSYEFGMVAITGVRYIRTDQPVAVAR